MIDGQDGYSKAKDKLRDIRFNSTIMIELELFRGQITPVNVPKGVVVRIYDYDVLDMGGDDQIARKGRHAKIPTTCMVKDWEGPII